MASIQHHVLWLDVSMIHATRVAVHQPWAHQHNSGASTEALVYHKPLKNKPIHTCERLLEEMASKWFIERARVLYDVKQVAILKSLQHK